MRQSKQTDYSERRYQDRKSMRVNVVALLLVMALSPVLAIAQEKLTPNLWKRIEEESPKPLPQSTTSNRATSDAFEEGLKGKVKRVIREYRSYSDVCADRGRYLSEIDDYDRNGNQLRNVSFANCGRLVGIQAYGYIDGFRASFYKSIPSGSYGRFTVLGEPEPKPNSPTQAADARYTYKYEYSFANGKLVEMRMVLNDGRRGMYYKYTSSPKERSTSAFTYDDRHNWRSVSKLDDDGNEIERINVDVRKVYGHDTVYRIRNKAFDRHGNWIERSTYKVTPESGETLEVPVSDEFRIITYH